MLAKRKNLRPRASLSNRLLLEDNLYKHSKCHRDLLTFNKQNLCLKNKNKKRTISSKLPPKRKVGVAEMPLLSKFERLIIIGRRKPPIIASKILQISLASTQAENLKKCFHKYFPIFFNKEINKKKHF